MTDQVWATGLPLCAAVLGSTEAASKLGLDTCRQLVLDAEMTRDPKAELEARRYVGEVGAGIVRRRAPTRSCPP